MIPEPPTQRLKALRGLEAMVAEDAETTIREMVDSGWEWETARDAYRDWVVEMFGAAADRGADLCR